MTAVTSPENVDEAPQMRLLDGDDVDALATVPVGLAAAEDAARLVTGGRNTTGRVQVNGPVAWMRILAGTLSDLDLLGYKEFHRVGQRVRYHVHLFRESTADALGIIDGRRITSLRTSATAAAAVRHWAGDAPVRVGLIGSGEEAREGLRAIAGAVLVKQAAVFSPTPANRAAFAQQMAAELGIPVRDVASQAEAIAGCDVLYVATSSHHKAFLSAADVAEVGLVAAIGSTQPVHRELLGDVFTSAGQVVVDTRDATHESGDCLEAREAGWDADSVVLLGDYLQTPAGQRTPRSVFKSVGSVEQDLVLAHHLLQAAEEQGRGTVVDPIGSLRVMR